MSGFCPGANDTRGCVDKNNKIVLDKWRKM